MTPTIPDLAEQQEDAVAASRAWLARGDLASALQVVEQALVRLPREPALLARRAYLLRYAGDLEGSLAAYKASIAAHPSVANRISAEGQMMKADIYRGAPGAALQRFEAIRQLRISDRSRIREKTFFYAGLAELYRANSPAAIAYFDAALAETPGTLWAAYADGYRAMASGDDERLGTILPCIARADVTDGERKYRLAHLYTGAGLYGLALRSLEESLQAGNWNAAYLETDALLDPLRKDQQFDRLVETANQRARLIATRPALDRDMTEGDF